MADPASARSGLDSFDEACQVVVDHLQRAVPLAFWSVTHHDGDRQVYLRVTDHAYGTSDGDSVPWSDTFCQHMMAGTAPRIAPDAMAVPVYAAVAGRTHDKTIGAYVGVPILAADGAMFGTLCGLDPEQQSDALLEHADLLHLCATLLSQILRAEQLRLESLDHEVELRWNVTMDRLLRETDPTRGEASGPGSATAPAPSTAWLCEPLRRALEAGEIAAHFQAVIDLRTSRPVGFEALARWRHDGLTITPDVFIPLAAQTGMMPVLTAHMLEISCAQVAAWSAELGHHDLRMGVNISPTCITDPALPERVAAQLARHDVRPHQLILEITEEALLRDLATATEVTHQLHDLGVRLALDDFGTGYSSLLHLSRIPLNSMKIDRGFILAVDTDPDAQRFVKALLNLAADLDLVVVVEGVERREQAEALRRLGAVYTQGHLYGLPAPAQRLDPRVG